MPGLRLVSQKTQKRRFSSLFPTPNLIYKREFLLWQDFQYLGETRVYLCTCICIRSLSQRADTAVSYCGL